MAQWMLTDIDGIKLAADDSRLKDSADYQKIRNEINRRFNPLAGSVDWEKVRTLCEKVATTDGADLLVAIYYTVASLKTQGLPGFANGLELQVAVLRDTRVDQAMPQAKRIELYRWMLGRLGEELRAMQPQLSQLRDLYRCERALQAIDRNLSQRGSEKVADLDVLGYTIFEHIDRLENSSRPNAAISPPPVEVKVKKQNASALLFVLGAMLGAAVLYGLQYVQGSRPSPTSELTIALAEPKIISLEEAQQIRSEFGAQGLKHHQSQLLNRYSDKLSLLTDADISDTFRSSLDLAESVQYLFPDSPEAQQMTESIQRWQSGVVADFDELNDRFVTARTRAANVSLLVRTGKIDQVQALAVGLENYAISLSPLIARITYAERLIQQGEFMKAETELEVLDKNLKSVVMKKMLLQRLLAKQKALASR
ncbi:Type VI secretion-related protein VasL [Enterovibrio norvegicus FF-33]|uniref:type VI secretion system ImpA family N-terminal domain-containing protein n=1 Tax=Enterovibrio norvegicus TaxID=188144 RepID=UPI00031234C6|nr:type VI secretion system ImpA family N-terminal domain-containing protein [Enterovibrio norvegicus]OEE67140.1 Type VI secretion-related protein VasL [Enterovibrio norvegicus FF-33]